MPTEPDVASLGRRIGSWAALALLVGVTSGLLAWLGVPSPVLFGSLAGGLVHALAWRPKVRFPGATFLVGQAIIGASVGSSLDFESLRQLGPDWPAVVGISIATILVSVGAGQLLRIHRGVTPVTATFASIAGGASGMVALAHDLGADDRVVTVVQYLRVLVILLTMPGVVAVVFSASADDSAGALKHADTVGGYVLAVLAVVVGLAFGKAAHLPSPAILGPMVAWPVLSLIPVFDGAEMPAPVQTVGFLLIGVQVGLRFTPASVKAIGRMLPTALVLIVAIIAVCAGLGVVLSMLTGATRLDGYLATTPGGLYAVLGVSTATGGDVTFVTAVQLLRLLLAIIPAPFIARWVTRARSANAEKGTRHP